MIDIHLFRKDASAVLNSLKARGSPKEVFDIAEDIIIKDEQWRKIKKEEELLRAERNKLNIEIINLKKSKKAADEQIKRSGAISARIKDIAEENEKLEAEIRAMLLQLPNILDKSVPKGKSSEDNQERRKWGKPKKHSKNIIDHHYFGIKTGLIDFELGARLAGHRFAVLKGPIAKLERALINFMLSLQVTHGYQEVLTPHLVNSKTIENTGQLPKFEKELYKCRDDDLWLIPTAEVPLTNLYAGGVLEEKDLPIRLCAYTPCYRREAGAYGKDIRGLIRQHQFNKVELVKFAPPESSFNELEGMVRDAEAVLQALELPYRVVELCTADVGFASAKTYDIEVWIPSQDTYREISSCSNCTDFQARRAGIKFRDAKGELNHIHTLNGSGLAIGRTLIAIIENYQEKNEIIIPKILQDFMGEESIEF